MLLVVSGLPASGKSHLGHSLARELGWPLVTKDDYKAVLYRHLPALEQRQAGPLSFELMYHVAGVVLAAGTSCVLETHFYRGVSEPKILTLAGQSGAELAQVFCHAPLDELRRRHAARVTSGARPHIDLPFDHAGLPPQAGWEPLELHAPLLRVNTTEQDSEVGALVWIQNLLSTTA